MKSYVQRMFLRTNRIPVGNPDVVRARDGYWYFYDKQGDLVGQSDSPSEAREKAFLYRQQLSKGPCDDDIVDPI
jgi:hypothetical protein